MKKLIVFVALAFGMMVSAQEKMNEGIIISKQTIKSDNEQAQERFAMMGDVITTTYFKNNKSRSELKNPMSGDIVTIMDTNTKEILVLMDSPGLGKKYVKQKREISEEQLKTINIVEGDKTKTILGYKCKQYLVTIIQNGAVVEMEIYTTTKIPIVATQTAMLGDKLKGFPLYMVMKMNQMGVDMTVTTEVTEINSAKVLDEKLSLTPPEGYTKIEE